MNFERAPGTVRQFPQGLRPPPGLADQLRKLQVEWRRAVHNLRFAFIPVHSRLLEENARTRSVRRLRAAFIWLFSCARPFGRPSSNPRYRGYAPPGVLDAKEPNERLLPSPRA